MIGWRATFGFKSRLLPFGYDLVDMNSEACLWDGGKVTFYRHFKAIVAVFALQDDVLGMSGPSSDCSLVAIIVKAFSICAMNLARDVL